MCRNEKIRFLSVRVISDTVDRELPRDIERLIHKKTTAGRLGAAAGKSFPEIEEVVAAAKNWSDWAFVYRYPSGEAPPVPDENELRRALDVIDELAARLRAANHEPGS